MKRETRRASALWQRREKGDDDDQEAT